MRVMRLIVGINEGKVVRDDRASANRLDTHRRFGRWERGVGMHRLGKAMANFAVRHIIKDVELHGTNMS